MTYLMAAVCKNPASSLWAGATLLRALSCSADGSWLRRASCGWVERVWLSWLSHVVVSGLSACLVFGDSLCAMTMSDPQLTTVVTMG